MNKEEKSAIVAELKDKFARSKALVFTDYKGMTVKELEDFRAQLRISRMEFKVVKNTLARIAAKDAALSLSDELWQGPVGVAFGFDDPVSLAKKVVEFTRKTDKLKISGAVIEGKFCASGDVKAVAELPPREVLLSVLIGTIQAPASKAAALFNAAVSRFAHVMNALMAKRQAS